MGWLRKSSRFLALQMIERDGRRAQSLGPEILTQLEDAWATLDRRSDADSLEAMRLCMDRLSESARRLVRFRYVDDLAGDRLAAAIGQSRSACYRHLAMATQQLAECVQRELTGGTR
jgi:DNA-directed RNA polymerase specialized sigma24 family protein